MRVSIQYTVDMDSIPTEMQRLVENSVIESLDVIGHALRDLFQNDDPEGALTTIHEARQALFSVDERLSDVDSILRGYIVQKAALIQAESNEASHESPAQNQDSQSETGEAVMMPASEDTMKMVQATLRAHKAETDALQRTMNLGFTQREEEGHGD